MNEVKYYNEDFKEIHDKSKAYWILNTEIIVIDILIHKLYEF